MTNYREIVTKAVISKGKKSFTTTHQVNVDKPSTILGCWVINHNFDGKKVGNDIVIDGSYDVNIWYSYENDTKTEVAKETNTYHEVIHMRDNNDLDGDEIIVRSLRQPNCVKVDIHDNSIQYTIEKELGIELVGNIKVKVEANDDEDPWNEIVEDSKDESKEEGASNNIDAVEENFIEDTI